MENLIFSSQLCQIFDEHTIIQEFLELDDRKNHLQGYLQLSRPPPPSLSQAFTAWTTSTTYSPLLLLHYFLQALSLLSTLHLILQASTLSPLHAFTPNTLLLHDQLYLVTYDFATLEKHLAPDDDSQKYLSLELDQVRAIFQKVYRDHLETEADQLGVMDDLISDLDASHIDLGVTLRRYSERFYSDVQTVMKLAKLMDKHPQASFKVL
jgi:hypothetical protein